VKVLMVHPRFDLRGGAENVVAWLAQGLSRRGHSVAVATHHFDARLWRSDAWDRVPIHLLGKPRALWPGRRASRTRRFGRGVASLASDSDLVVAHNFPAAVWATSARRWKRLPRVIWYCHEPLARLHWRAAYPTLSGVCDAEDERYPWARGAFREVVTRMQARPPHRSQIDRELDFSAVAQLDGILANSAFTAEMVARTYERSALPCPPGVPAPPAASGKRPTRPYVALITTPTPPKNAIGFLEAVRIAVHERGAGDLRVRAVGIGSDFLRAVAAEAGVAEIVAFEPWLTEAELHELIAGCRLLVYPSIEEPFGLVPIEAMAHGRPVVASIRGGTRESVVPGVTGLLTDALDPAAMADAMLALWNDPSRCDQLGAAGRNRYLDHFTLDHFVERFEKLALAS
jgi:glycosyltransferase involved in cell wall biosynthesis